MVPRVELLFPFWTRMVAAGFVPVAFTCRSCCDLEYVALVIFKESPGATVRLTLAEPPLYAAIRVTVVVLDTPLPCTAKETDDCPAAIVTVDGNFADFESLAESASTAPPAGAG